MQDGLMNISPIDGRYTKSIDLPKNYFPKYTIDEKGYEKLKELTQRKKIDEKTYLTILKKLKLDKNKKFKKLKPENYLGLSEKLAEMIC